LLLRPAPPIPRNSSGRPARCLSVSGKEVTPQLPHSAASDTQPTI
jgi:hypothetical protein